MKKIFFLFLMLTCGRALQAQGILSENRPAPNVAEPISAPIPAESAPAPTTPASAPATMTAQDSLKQSIAQLKTAFADVNKLFARKSDTISVMVSPIDYDNGNLSLLKDALKKGKNVRSVAMHYSGTTATIDVACKAKPTDLWDSMPANVKAVFKISELGDKSIRLNVR